MLPPFIIEQIRRREEEKERREFERPRLELPDAYRPREPSPEELEETTVVILDLG